MSTRLAVMVGMWAGVVLCMATQLGRDWWVNRANKRDFDAVLENLAREENPAMRHHIALMMLGRRGYDALHKDAERRAFESKQP